ncbi:hypothetical protein C8F04DRAFT_234898 [Mycena alexandri]|uniref:Uncharacterized protein n=1 Tax=Mycena alexandri TaxID=1745969 RepID=A0AAD6SBQ6_9AGAR|nr:hypothetical protein C8F04DRAFT_234898 [Mycena alexandri]
MGGSAFSAILPASALPRIPPAVYQALKARLTPRLQTLYSMVATPYEAPEKADHGDLDLLVCGPSDGAKEVPHATVQTLLRAKYVVPMPGNRTSNYAVPIERGEWALLGHQAEEEAARRCAAEDGQQETYYQVDVHVCLDESEWRRLNFFHGYGDLGIILGLLARSRGLALGSTGFKIQHHPRPPFELTESMDNVVQYMGLSMERWNAGFRTKQEVFEWVGTSSLFDLTRFRTEGPGISKIKPGRKMYAGFVEWVKEQQRHSKMEVAPARSREDEDEQIEHALRYFGKKEAFDALEREEADRVRLKEVFNGNSVRTWVGLRKEEWKELKMIIDEVRRRAGGEAGILKILDERGEDGVKECVLQAAAKLGVL